MARVDLSELNESISIATYSSLLKVDPVIFNLPENSTREYIQPTQLQGQIFAPRALSKDSSTPLVLLLHGRHADCRSYLKTEDPALPLYPWDVGVVNANGTCPTGTEVVKSYRGFDYLGQALAQEGYIAVSIDLLLLNHALPEPGDPDLVSARARLLLRTLELLNFWDMNGQRSFTDLGFDISKSIDFHNIGIMGHSRGGNAARRAYNIINSPDSMSKPELRRWGSTLNVSFAGIFEVASYDESYSEGIFNVIGVPWALLEPGCDHDIADFSALKVLQRQSRLNTEPNHLISLYGGDHSYFNTEWPYAIDVCLGDQNLTWSSHGSFKVLYLGDTFNVPLVTDSPSQRATLKWALMAFMKGYVGQNAVRSYAKTVYRLLPILGVEIGRADPNLGTAKILQDFRNTSKVITTPRGLLVETIGDHAINSIQEYSLQVQKYGWPPTALPPQQNTSDFPQLGYNSTTDEGAVVTLTSATATIEIEVDSLSKVTPGKPDCTLQIDIARRDTCYLASSQIVRHRCSKPLNLKVKLTAGGETSSTSILKSRFNVEWGFVDVSRRLAANDQALLPVFWETINMPCPIESFSNAKIEISGQGSKDFSPSLLYLGALRQTVGAQANY